MPRVELENMNASLVESAATTYTDDKFEIPGTSGAKRVVLRDGRMMVTEPGVADGINISRGAVLAGDKTALTSIPTLGTEGCIAANEGVLNADGTDYIMAYETNANRRCTVPWSIPKASDGKYYITLAVQGVGNTNPISVRFNGAFAVER